MRRSPNHYNTTNTLVFGERTTMNTNKGVMAVGALVAFMGSALLAPMTARASEEGKRNTTIGLGAGAAALLLTQKNKIPGALVGAGAVYSGISLQNDINRRHKREREQAYNRRLRAQRSARAHRTYRHHN